MKSLLMMLTVLTAITSFVWPAEAATIPAGCQRDSARTEAKFDTVKMYPSLTPRSFVLAQYGTLVQLRDDFDPQANTSWLLTDKGGDSGVHPSRVDLGAARLSYVAHLFFDPHVIQGGEDAKKEYELYVISRRGGVPTCTKYSGTITFDKSDPYTLKFSPTFAPDAEKTSGDSILAGRLGIKLDYPSLFDNRFANVYVKVDSVLSTDSKDRETKIEPRIGLERSLLSSWYVPAHLDFKYIGSQSGDDQSFVSSTGLQTLLPWERIGNLLSNVLIKAPVSPVLGLSTEWQEILREKGTSSIKSQFRLVGDFHWNPIYLLAKQAPTAKDISLEIGGKFWWFPDESRNDRNFRDPTEHRLDLSLIIPTALINLSGLSPELLSGLTGGDKKLLDGSARIVIKYSTGANEAQGFRNASDVSIKFQYVK